MSFDPLGTWHEPMDYDPPVRSVVGSVSIRHEGGRRWRIEAPDGRWSMQPEGAIDAGEARALCWRIATALASCDERGFPLAWPANVTLGLLFVGGLAAGAIVGAAAATMFGG